VPDPEIKWVQEPRPEAWSELMKTVRKPVPEPELPLKVEPDVRGSATLFWNLQTTPYIQYFKRTLKEPTVLVQYTVQYTVRNGKNLFTDLLIKCNGKFREMMQEKLFLNTLLICPFYIKVFLSFKYWIICTYIYITEKLVKLHGKLSFISFLHLNLNAFFDSDRRHGLQYTIRVHRTLIAWLYCTILNDFLEPLKKRGPVP
jgi:hypothetical protein